MAEVKIERDEVRVSFTISPESYDRMRQSIPWGVRSEFFRRILEISLSRIERGGYAVVGAIIAGDFDPLQKEESNP